MKVSRWDYPVAGVSVLHIQNFQITSEKGSHLSWTSLPFQLEVEVTVDILALAIETSRVSFVTFNLPYFAWTDGD